MPGPHNHESSLWNYFYKIKGRKYKEDQTHNAAWCKACVGERCRELQRNDQVEVVQGNREAVRSETEVFEAGACYTI